MGLGHCAGRLLSEPLSLITFILKDGPHVLPRPFQKHQPFLRGDDSLRDPTTADVFRMRQTSTLGIGIDLHHDSSHHLQAAAINVLVPAHASGL